MNRLLWLYLPAVLILTNLSHRAAAQKQQLLPLNAARNYTVSSKSPIEILVEFSLAENETAALRLETTGYSNRTLLLIARQQLVLHTWSLPFIFDNVDDLTDEKPAESFQSVGRTLCPPQLWPQQQQQQQQVLLQVSTQSEAPVSLSSVRESPGQATGRLQEVNSVTSEPEPDGVRTAGHAAEGRQAELHMVHVGHAMQLLAIAIFYCLPVVQLVLLQQTSFGSGGNLDHCYYNFKCRFYVRTSIGSFYAFNNVVSNAGYIAAGIVFMLTVKFKEKFLDAAKTQNRAQGNQDTVVIPRCYSAHYAAGLALAMEGVLSACYHICPSHDTFQFDTAFMLMLASMLGLAVYSKRNLSSGKLTNVTFVALAVTVVVNSGGILLSNISRKIPFAFLGVALLSAGLLAGLALCFKQNWRKNYKCILAALIFVNLLLGILSFILGFIDECRILFAYMVLAVALGNTGMYFIYYCFRKCMTKTCCRKCITKTCCRKCVTKTCCATQGENSLPVRVRYCTLSVVLISIFAGTFVWSLFYFFNAPTDWDRLSPAGSRKLNNECYVRWFGLPLDQHDLWHLLGSGALFCLLLFVLFMDVDEERLELTEGRTY